jgi:uncharacterized protein YecE (DUF72 family)
MSNSAQCHIGTSGWNYNHWRGRFYPDDLPAHEWFAHYAGVFNTVEINNTFYQLPATKTLNAWHKQAPQGFIYAVKANRFITHLKKLKDPKKPLAHFLKRARRLRRHLGPVLYQLPPHWKPDVERLARFCEHLPADLTHVVEFRERAWLQAETYAALAEHGVCLCIHDLLKRHPRRITGKAVYVRFHGVGSKYGGGYSRRRLRRWADWMREAADEGHDVYAYFNNDRNAYAVRDAQTLRELLGVG